MAFDQRYGWVPSKPIAVEGGIAARSTRGNIGESWWSQRFVAVLESFGMDGRLTRGRAYARKGQVLSLNVQPGLVHAVVQGSRSRPYRVMIGLDELSAEDWTAVAEAFSTKAIFLAKLLAGEMPNDIETAFASRSLSLFPAHRSDLEMACSCPDVVNPCKHIAATLYLLAESFDEDPFSIFEWRGRGKEELLAGLRRGKQTATTSHPSSDDLPEETPDPDEKIWRELPPDAPVVDCIEHFWNTAPELTSVRPDTSASAHPDVLLRQLDPFPLSIGNATLVEVLAPAIARIAEAVAADERNS